MATRICLLILFFLLNNAFSFAQNQSLPVIDRSDAALGADAIELNEWAHFPGRLLPDQAAWPVLYEIVSIASIAQQIKFSTFVLTVRLSPTAKNKELAIEIPSIFSSYQLWMNGGRIGGKGKVGTTLQETLPEMGSAIYFFTPAKDTVQFIIQASNFYPNHGGVKGPIRLGDADNFRQKTELIKIMDNTLFIVLSLLVIISLCFYYMVFEHRNVFLFQSLFGLAWLIRSLFGYHYRIAEWIDLPWAWVMRVEYWSIIFTTVFAMLFIASLFPTDFGKNIKNIALAISGLFAVSVLFLSPNTFLPQIKIYLGFSCVTLAYVFYVIVKAFLDERGGTTLMLISIFLGAIAFGYAIASYFGFFVVDMMVYDISFMVLGVMLSVSVWIRVSKIDRLSETKVLTMEHFFSEQNNLGGLK